MILKKTNLQIIAGVVVFFLICSLVVFKFRGEILFKLGEYTFLTLHHKDAAEYLLEKSVATKPSLMNTFTLGRVYFVNGDLQNAINMFEKSIPFDPDFSKNYYMIGLSYGFTYPEFYSIAEENFKKYLELSPAEYGSWAGYNDLAWVQFLQGKYQESILSAKKGLTLTQSNPWLKNTIGVNYMSLHKCELALPYLQEAKVEIENISAEQFGEAYSGDSPNFWAKGKQNMQQTIEENILICQSKKK